MSVTSYLLEDETFYKRIITFNWEVYFLSGTSLIFYVNGNNVASAIILFFFLYFLVKLICATQIMSGRERRVVV